MAGVLIKRKAEGYLRLRDPVPRERGGRDWHHVTTSQRAVHTCTHVYTDIWLFIHQLINTCVPSTFWPLKRRKEQSPSEPPKETNLAGTLISDFWPPEL